MFVKLGVAFFQSLFEEKNSKSGKRWYVGATIDLALTLVLGNYKKENENKGETKKGKERIIFFKVNYMFTKWEIKENTLNIRGLTKLSDCIGLKKNAPFLKLLKCPHI